MGFLESFTSRDVHNILYREFFDDIDGAVAVVVVVIEDADFDVGMFGLQGEGGNHQAIESAKVVALPHQMFDSQHGGKIATLPNDKSMPIQAFYKVRVVFNAQPNITNMTLASVKINTQAKAWLPSVVERIAALFVRESGF